MRLAAQKTVQRQEDEGGLAFFAEWPEVPREVPDDSPLWIVQVDRSVAPTSLPPHESEPLFPDEEKTGPTEYNLLKLGLWLNGSQKTGHADAQSIFAGLKETGAIANFPGLLDAEEIVKNHVEILESKLFWGKEIVFWRGARTGLFRNIIVPVVRAKKGVAEQYWSTLYYDWGQEHPSFKF